MALLRFDAEARQEWRRHWPVVLAGAGGMALASAPVYTTGVMFRPLEQEFGWSRAAIASGQMIPAVAAVFFGPLIGLAVDRFGPRRLGMAGVLAACGTLALLSTAQSSIWTWWALWVAMAASATLIKPTIWAAGVSSLFKESRGLALALMLSGTAVCSSLTPPLANYLVESHGWRAAYLALGAVWAMLVVPPVWLFFSSAADQSRVRKSEAAAQAPADLPGCAAREALLSWRYVRLVIGAMTMTIGTVTCVVSLVPILVSLGHGRSTAAAVAGVIGVTTVVGRLTGGYLLDRLNGNLVAASSLLLTVAACTLLLAFPPSVPVAVVAVLLLGFSMGAELDAVAYLTTRHFGLRSFGVLFGTLGGLQALATGSGPFLVNSIYDATGSYRLAVLLFIPVCLLGAVLFLSLGRYPDFSARRPASAAPQLAADAAE